jgi:phosphoribosylformylglycinamidine cyclo-ligase
MTDYKGSGVDVKKGEEAVRRLKKHVETTFTDKVLRGIGSFGGAIDVKDMKADESPVLVSSIDGVGTKTIIAEMANQWEGTGHDIVNHSANDLVCQGARSLVFLDYIASGKLNPETVEAIVKGASEACRDLGCVLIGGETAEMPKVYHEGAHDIVGSIVGSVDRDKMITGEGITKGDVCIALPSNGLHTNGYSLARKVLIEDAKMDLESEVAELGCCLAEALLKAHTPYANLVLALNSDGLLKGVAHITGGGIPGNLVRILPKGLGAEIKKSVIVAPPIFTLIQKTGGISDEAMFEAFNMGAGMILVVSPEDVDATIEGSEGGYVVGKIVEGNGIAIVNL